MTTTMTAVRISPLLPLVCGLLLLLMAGTARAVALVPVWENLPQVVGGVYLPQTTQQLLVAQKTGEVRWLHEGSGRSELVHRFAVNTQSEMGLLGLALHPQFPADPRIFVHLNPAGAALRSQIIQLRWVHTAGRMPILQQPEVLFDIAQPYANHNGGGMAFGPDGMLYIGLGDGGSHNDTARRAQNTASLLGKILRIDVDRRRPGVGYSIPPDNPLVEQDGARPEIWAIGVRNPVHLTFDDIGQLWLADGGHNDVQEINRVSGGDNMGWRCFVGARAFERDDECFEIEHTPPVLAYELRGGQAVAGGVWYDGYVQPWLRGHYIFADFVQGYLWAMDTNFQRYELGNWDIHPSAFIMRPDGALLVADYVGGVLYRLIDVEDSG